LTSLPLHTILEIRNQPTIHPSSLGTPHSRFPHQILISTNLETVQIEVEVEVSPRRSSPPISSHPIHQSKLSLHLTLPSSNHHPSPKSQPNPTHPNLTHSNPSIYPSINQPILSIKHSSLSIPFLSFPPLSLSKPPIPRPQAPSPKPAQQDLSQTNHFMPAYLHTYSLSSSQVPYLLSLLPAHPQQQAV
jgi:hypothetical protein